MIAVDTSALCAVVLGEPDAESFLAALEAHRGSSVVGAPTVLEALVVVEARQGPDAVRDLHLLIEGAQIEVEPFGSQHAELAHGAWSRFGRGRHPAGLNLGDCLTYAVARRRGAPLLFKGDDFRQTDLRAVL